MHRRKINKTYLKERMEKKKSKELEEGYKLLCSCANLTSKGVGVMSDRDSKDNMANVRMIGDPNLSVNLV